MSINAADISKLVNKSTARWAKQRKAEERDARARANRATMFRPARISHSSVAAKILPDGYAHASDNGRLPVTQRQLYYACRETFREATGRSIDYKYFANTLLPQFMNRHPDRCEGWRINADPRGTLVIPNANEPVRIPCGTVLIDEHLANRRSAKAIVGAPNLPLEWPSLEGGQRYKAVLYIEKEGFEPLLQQERIAERYEIAILSCKGQSVVAARKFVDMTCGVNGGVPLLVVHDFDKYGFSIAQRLTSVSFEAEEADRVRYRFQNEINVTDLGLRLEDVERYSLPDERHRFKGNWPDDCDVTDEEKAFIEGHRRVELNAFTSAQFIAWLEEGMAAAGLKAGLVPDDAVLQAAYRRAVTVHHMNRAVEKVAAKARRLAKRAAAPPDLSERVRQAIEKHAEPWDLALYRVIRDQGE
jgi:hypothetical protein